MKMIAGMTNTGMMTIGLTATGYIIPMVTIVSIMSGGIRGGGVGIGIIVIGVTISLGISSIQDSMLSGMKMVDGGIDHDTDTG